MPKFTKKAWILIVVLVLAAGAGSAYLFWPEFKEKVGDVRPVILPPKKALSGKDLVDLKIPSGFEMGLFAQGLGRARDVVFSPGGTLLVSLPDAGQIAALPDRNNDGLADERIAAVDGLRNPHGIAFYKGKLFVAEERQVVRYSWNESSKTAKAEKKLFDLPAGDRHSTRTIAFDSNGRMFVSVGSSCDVCREEHRFLATVITSDSEGSEPRVYARGLRNAVFITTNPGTDEIWGTEMGRDFLGDNLPPDEINILREGKDYGWPDCYGNKVPDRRFNPSASCAGTEPPVYGIAAHSAPLGLLFIDSHQFPDDWQGDLLVAYHGSWNRSSPIGYKVVRLTVEGNRVTGEDDFISGFLVGSRANGRPVDMAFDREGSLFLSDDKAGAIYKVVSE